MGEENQEQFISWLSSMLQATDEEDLKRKVQELGEEGIKNAYNQFMEESTEIRSNKQGGKLEYIKCLQELAKGGKVNCGCGGAKLSLKKEEGGSLMATAGPKFGSKAKWLKLQPKKIVMGQGMSTIAGIVDKKQLGGLLSKANNLRDLNAINVSAPSTTQQIAPPQMVANGAGRSEDINDFYNRVGTNAPVKAGAGFSGIPYGRAVNGQLPMMSEQELAWLRQNSDYLKRPDVRTGTPIQGRPYNSMEGHFMQEYQDYHTNLLSGYRDSQRPQQGVPQQGLPFKLNPAMQQGMVASRQQGGKLASKPAQNNNQGGQMMQAPTPEQIQEQKVDAKVQEMTMKQSNIKLTPMDQLMQSLQPKQIKPKQDKKIRLVSRNNILAGKE